jgi:hypothetical protein
MGFVLRRGLYHWDDAEAAKEFKVTRYHTPITLNRLPTLNLEHCTLNSTL